MGEEDNRKKDRRQEKKEEETLTLAGGHAPVRHGANARFKHQIGVQNLETTPYRPGDTYHRFA